VLGGVTTAGLALLLGSLVRPAVPPPAGGLLVVGLALFVLAGEAGLHSWLLPHRRSQVPQSVLGEGADAGALRFGFEMGTGMRTHMPSNLPYVPLAAVALVAGWPAALLTGAGFGLGRAGMALGRYHARDPGWWDRQWQQHGHAVRFTLALLVVALSLPIALP
jgi:hypothetical protein